MGITNSYEAHVKAPVKLCVELREGPRADGPADLLVEWPDTLPRFGLHVSQLRSLLRPPPLLRSAQCGSRVPLPGIQTLFQTWNSPGTCVNALRRHVKRYVIEYHPGRLSATMQPGFTPRAGTNVQQTMATPAATMPATPRQQLQPQAVRRVKPPLCLIGSLSISTHTWESSGEAAPPFLWLPPTENRVAYLPLVRVLTLWPGCNRSPTPLH